MIETFVRKNQAAIVKNTAEKFAKMGPKMVPLGVAGALFAGKLVVALSPPRFA